MRSIVTMGNCQGLHLAYLLGECLPADEFQVQAFSNNGRTGDLKKPEEITHAVAACDLFVYQPLAEKHGPMASSALLGRLKPGAQAVSFPYFFNSGAYSLCHAPQAASGKPYGAIFGEEIILSLLREGVPPAEILQRYRQGCIDFRVPQRFAESHAQMRQRQEGCQIRLTGFIKKHHRQHKLFLTHNHPSNLVFFVMLRQLAELTGLPLPNEAPAGRTLNQLGQTNCPISPHDIEAMGYDFEPDEDWCERGSALIEQVIAHAQADAGAKTC